MQIIDCAFIRMMLQDNPTGVRLGNSTRRTPPAHCLHLMESIASDEENSLYTKLPLPSQQYGSTQSVSHDRQSIHPFAKFLRLGSLVQQYDSFKENDGFINSSLDPRAPEVTESVSSKSIFDQFFLSTSTINYNTLRTKYKLKRKQYRDNTPEVCSFIDNFRHCMNYDAYVSHLRRVLFTNWVIVLFVR
ncbi:hypothetical protein BCR42DRAFT_396224 [Absidia repens]|uniref:Uncharacterized protein n=1 Tax=Absidia repens TaxID=90262 RepID=A0A1X2I5F8_9FUNG|nr:hypothetical protein BCR42DRAFT_396224 [Absidia repens]